MYFSQNLDNIWTTSIEILSKRFHKFTDSTFKSKQLIYLIINMLYNIITPSKIPYSAGKYVILPNPNRITKQKSKVFDYQRLSIFFIVFLASFWRDNYYITHSSEYQVSFHPLLFRTFHHILNIHSSFGGL